MKHTSDIQNELTFEIDILAYASVGSGVGFTVNNALGRLTRVTFQGGYYLYSYNADGQVERMYNKLDGLSGKTVHYNYNWLGEPIHVQYQPGASDSHYWWVSCDQDRPDGLGAFHHHHPVHRCRLHKSDFIRKFKNQAVPNIFMCLCKSA